MVAGPEPADQPPEVQVVLHPQQLEAEHGKGDQETHGCGQDEFDHELPDAEVVVSPGSQNAPDTSVTKHPRR
jgi:hypothetical protein